MFSNYNYNQRNRLDSLLNAKMLNDIVKCGATNDDTFTETKTTSQILYGR